MFKPSKFVPRPVQNDLPIFNLEEITETEVANIIRSLKASKAKDAYGLDTNFLKTNADSLVAPITSGKSVHQTTHCSPSMESCRDNTNFFNLGPKLTYQTIDP